MTLFYGIMSAHVQGFLSGFVVCPDIVWIYEK
jgi:tetrahydromethanopterin S-methyltransferase subunit F